MSKIFRNGRPATFGVGENFCPTLPYNCPPRPWEPDPGPETSIRDRLGTGRPQSSGVGVSGLACWPREWKPDEGQTLGIGGRPRRGSQFGVGGSPYADSLAAVGLTPDNPDPMYAQLMDFIQNPEKFKNADPCWPGAKDDKTWWEDPKGTIALQWPFGGGKWLDNAPKTDAQMRAVFKIPDGTATKDFLYQLYGVTSPLTTFRIDAKGHKCKSGGFDLGSALGKAWDAVKTGIGDVRAVADALHIPGANLTAALLTGGDLGEALKQDVNGFVAAGQLAGAIVSGNPSGIAAAATSSITQAAQKFGISIPSGAVQAAAQVAQTVSAAGGDPSQILTQAAQQAGSTTPAAAIQSAVSAIKSDASPDQILSQLPGMPASAVQAAIVAARAGGDPSKLANLVATTALGDSYKDAWNVATNFGKIKTDMPAPVGLSYAPGAKPASSANPHPIQVHLGGKSLTVKGGGAYGPYPDSGKVSAAPAAAGTTAGVGNLDRGGGGGHGGGGGGRGGGGWHGGGGRGGFRGRGWGRGYGGGGAWWPYVVVGDASCASWGDPIDFPTEILPAVRTTLIGAAGEPVAVRGADGGLYLISLGGSARLVTVRPCIGATGVGSAADDGVLRAMALDLLGSLRRSVPQGATRSVMSFQQAWNAASADTQIATDGKYTGETEGALNAALGALAPGSGAVPAAVL